MSRTVVDRFGFDGQGGDDDDGHAGASWELRGWVTGMTLLSHRRLSPYSRVAVIDASHGPQARTVTSVAGGADDVVATTLAVMASKTAARSGTRTSRSKATSRSGSRACAAGGTPQAGEQARQTAQSFAAGGRRADLRPGPARDLADGGKGHRRRGPVDRAGPRHRARDIAATGSRWSCWACPSSSPPARGSTPPGRSARGSTRCCGPSSARASWRSRSSPPRWRWC